MNTKDTELLDVSLIIATYNEEESLGYVLNEIKDFNIGEIIIIDKNSTDDTKNIAERIYDADKEKANQLMKRWISGIISYANA